MKIIGNDLEAAVKNLIVEIKNSKTYLSYRKQKENINDDEELKLKIEELQRLNFMMQNSPEGPNSLEEQERLEQQFEDLCEDSRVNDFFQAELDFCRLFQDTLQRIVKDIDFE